MKHQSAYLLALLVTLCKFLTISTSFRLECSKSEYQRCVHLADPLIKEVQFIFPDNVNDIDLVCRTWNDFVDCLKSYTERCFSDTQRHQFNKAVEMPIASVHQMCTQSSYQKEYLRYAPCMKSTIVPGGNCGPHYNLLVDQVNQGDIISKATLCCSHSRFKQCVVEQVGEMCDQGTLDGPAVSFSTQIIDKALSFLKDQCYNYVPNLRDCTNMIAARAENYPLHSDPITVSTIVLNSREKYPRWDLRDDTLNKKVYQTVITPPTITTWLPSSPELTSISEMTVPSSLTSFRPPYEVISETSSISADLGLGSRSRPASYGRSRAWFKNGDSNRENAAELPGILPTAPKLPEEAKTSGATISSWTVIDRSFPPGYETSQNTYGHEPSSSSTTWYPAAGNQLSNEVDEPNQMGLVKPDNSSSRIENSRHVVLLMSYLAWRLSTF